jgi:hypothetical protein
MSINLNEFKWQTRHFKFVLLYLVLLVLARSNDDVDCHDSCHAVFFACLSSSFDVTSTFYKIEKVSQFKAILAKFY